jgi:6-phosphogluconolactonase
MTVFETADILADHVAAWLLSRVAGQASAAVCLSGGSTPKRLYERLAGPGYIERFPWDKVHWFWGDERFVPVDHPDNNYRMVKLAMLSKAPIPMDNIHPIETDASDAAAAAAHYERVLQFHYGADRLDPMRPLFDVTLLGLGPDGHTASLIPGQSVLNERERWAAAVTEGRPEARITLTYPPLESSRAIAFLVTGSDKAAMLAAVRRGDAHVPAAGLRSSAESHWFVDRAAAGE